MTVADQWMRGFVLVVFNMPILVICWSLRLVEQLNQALREKPRGSELGAVSYSRVTGLFGAVVTTSLFWAFGNIVIWRVFEDPNAAGKVMVGTIYLFLVGSALFLPYAFNQLRSMVNPIEATIAQSYPKAADPPPDKMLASGVVVPKPGKIVMEREPKVSNTGGPTVFI